jgi:hypothetical protein
MFAFILNGLTHIQDSKSGLRVLRNKAFGIIWEHYSHIGQLFTHFLSSLQVKNPGPSKIPPQCSGDGEGKIWLWLNTNELACSKILAKKTFLR